MDLKCPHCGSDRNTILVDENSTEVKCLDCSKTYAQAATPGEIDPHLQKRTAQYFQGETMKCCMCRKEQQRDPNVKSQWTVIDADGLAFYVCPGCLQESEQAKRGHYATVYGRVLRRIMRLRDRHMRGLNN